MQNVYSSGPAQRRTIYCVRCNKFARARHSRRTVPHHTAPRRAAPHYQRRNAVTRHPTQPGSAQPAPWPFTLLSLPLPLARTACQPPSAWPDAHRSATRRTYEHTRTRPYIRRIFIPATAMHCDNIAGCITRHARHATYALRARRGQGARSYRSRRKRWHFFLLLFVLYSADHSPSIRPMSCGMLALHRSRIRAVSHTAIWTELKARQGGSTRPEMSR